MFTKKEKVEAIEALKSMSSPAARVLRGWTWRRLTPIELVPGDIVALEAGDVVPADLRLLEANPLKLKKQPDRWVCASWRRFVSRACCRCWYWWPCEHGLPKFKRDLWSWNGCCCQYRYVNLKLVSIAGMLQDAGWDGYALQTKLEQPSKVLTHAILVIALLLCSGVFIQGKKSTWWVDDLYCACGCAIPEGLPAIEPSFLPLVLGFATKRNSIVRKLPAVETLGSTEITALIRLVRWRLWTRWPSKSLLRCSPTWLSWWHWTRSWNAPYFAQFCQWYEKWMWKETWLVIQPKQPSIQYALDKALRCPGILEKYPRGWVAIWLWP